MSAIKNSRAELLRTLGILGADFDEQVDYLCALGVPGVFDELGLEFDDIYPMAPTLHAEGLLTDQQVSALAAVDLKLQEMSSEEKGEVWTEVGLRDSDEWAQLRALARQAAASLSGE